MVRVGGFSLRLLVDRRPVREWTFGAQQYALAEAGSAFEVRVQNDNRATYLLRLEVDGVEAEPGYLKKLRGEDETVYRGFLDSRRTINEFIFARTPVDEAAAPTSRAADASIGEVRFAVFATRRVQLDASSSEDESPARGRRGPELGVRALPEKQAVKELGVQARAGGSIETLPRHRRHRRGEYRYEKVKPEVATLSLRYRDSFWFAQHEPEPAAELRGEGDASVKPEPAASAPALADDVVGPSARPLLRRIPGETARAPDGRRRKLAKLEPTADGSSAAEVIELSD